MPPFLLLNSFFLLYSVFDWHMCWGDQSCHHMVVLGLILQQHWMHRHGHGIFETSLEIVILVLLPIFFLVAQRIHYIPGSNEIQLLFLATRRLEM
jgi:hypothetical protein